MKKNKLIISIFLILAISIGIGYSYLETDLNINTKVHLKRAPWKDKTYKVKWDNIFYVSASLTDDINNFDLNNTDLNFMHNIELSCIEEETESESGENLSPTIYKIPIEYSETSQINFKIKTHNGSTITTHKMHSPKFWPSKEDEKEWWIIFYIAIPSKNFSEEYKEANKKYSNWITSRKLTDYFEIYRDSPKNSDWNPTVTLDLPENIKWSDDNLTETQKRLNDFIEGAHEYPEILEEVN